MWTDLVGPDEEGLYEYEARTLATTWKISLEQVRRQDEDAASLLALLGCFSNRDIWYELIRAGANGEALWIGRVTENKIRSRRAMSKLQDYNLVDMVAGSYQIHLCLHDWLVESIVTEPQLTLFTSALLSVAISVREDRQLSRQLSFGSPIDGCCNTRNILNLRDSNIYGSSVVTM